MAVLSCTRYQQQSLIVLPQILKSQLSIHIMFYKSQLCHIENASVTAEEKNKANNRIVMGLLFLFVAPLPELSFAAETCIIVMPCLVPGEIT